MEFSALSDLLIVNIKCLYLNHFLKAGFVTNHTAESTGAKFFILLGGEEMRKH